MWAPKGPCGRGKWGTDTVGQQEGNAGSFKKHNRGIFSEKLFQLEAFLKSPPFHHRLLAWPTSRERGERRVNAAEALTFDTVVGAVRRRPSRAALSPADIPPAGSAKRGQHRVLRVVLFTELLWWSRPLLAGPGGTLPGWPHCPPSLGSPHGPGVSTLTSCRSNTDS